MYFDNISAKYIAQSLVQHLHTKHVDIDIHFIQEQVLRKYPVVEYYPLKYQLADLLTKVLPRTHISKLRSKLMVHQQP